MLILFSYLYGKRRKKNKRKRRSLRRRGRDTFICTGGYRPIHGKETKSIYRGDLWGKLKFGKEEETVAFTFYCVNFYIVFPFLKYRCVHVSFL